MSYHPQTYMPNLKKKNIMYSECENMNSKYIANNDTYI